MGPWKGIARSGQTRWIRISSESTVPIATATTESRRYWMPMMWWSVERM
jgi:hypothetical protein